MPQISFLILFELNGIICHWPLPINDKKYHLWFIWDFLELPQNSSKIKSTTKSQKVPYDWTGTAGRLSRIFYKFLIKWNTFRKGNYRRTGSNNKATMDNFSIISHKLHYFRLLCQGRPLIWWNNSSNFIWAASWQNQQNGMCTKWRLRSAQSGKSSLSTWRKLGSLATHWAHSEDSDQTRRMPRLIWVFAGRTLILLVLSCRGSSV